jgi:GTP cyclohydrolase IB
MNAPEKMFLPDVQSSIDGRNVAIQRVGVKGLTHPVSIATPRGPQPSVACAAVSRRFTADSEDDA